MDPAITSLEEYTRESKVWLLTTTKNCPIRNRKINGIDEKENNDDDSKIEGKTILWTVQKRNRWRGR